MPMKEGNKRIFHVSLITDNANTDPRQHVAAYQVIKGRWKDSSE